MADRLQLEVVTPERAVLKETVDDVVLPGDLGQMNILPGHLPLLTLLDVGPLVIRQDGQKRFFFIDRGYAEIADDKVTVLTEACEGVNDIDVAQARAQLEETVTEISRLEELSKTEQVEASLFESHRNALRRQRLRLAFAEENPAD